MNTIQDLIERINGMAAKSMEAAEESIIIPAASAMTANIINRNANRGENSDGSKRDGYSTKPIYANRDKFVRKSSFVPQGKTGRGNFKNGNERKSMELPGGYKQLREIQGRRTDIKNYDYTGDTLNAFGFGKNNLGIAIGFRNERAAIIRKALEEKNGAAFPPSEQEKQEYIQEVTKNTKELQIQIISGR